MALNGWKEKLYRRYLLWICRPARLKRHLNKVLPSSKIAANYDRRMVRAAALQIEIKLVKDPIAYLDEMHRHVRKAVEEKADLVVFPEYNNLHLLSLLPGFEKMEEEYRKTAKKEGSLGKTEDASSGEDVSLTDIFSYMSPAIEPLIETLFSRLAKAYGIYIMSGSYTLSDNGRVVNRSFLYGPDGNLVGNQDKVHLLPVEEEWKLKRGSSFSSFETELGTLAIPVCMDATYYETFRILEQKGTDIVLLPIANMEEYNYWLALRGIWPRVQESLLFGVKSALVGSIAGLTFSGRAGIFAPLEITPQKNGVLAEVEQYHREAVAAADLDLDALDELRRNHPWRDSNRTLYRRYFPKIYK